jgi:hypothetical protein
MTDTIHVEPEDVLRTVLTRWEDVTGEQISALADQVSHYAAGDGISESKQVRLDADASILGSLACCKTLPAATDYAALARLWAAVKDGDGLSVGGLIHGDESRHFDAATRFVERLFLSKVTVLLEAAFEQEAHAAGGLPTAAERAAAFERAADTLDRAFEVFDFEGSEVDDALWNKRDLLEQLSDAEQDPGRIRAAMLFVYNVHRHLHNGAWTTWSESTLDTATCQRIARRVISDEKVMASAEKYEVAGVVEFGKGKASTGTIAFRSVAEWLGKPTTVRKKRATERKARD